MITSANADQVGIWIERCDLKEQGTAHTGAMEQ